MPKKHQAGGLGARERQILDVIYRLGEASVGEVLAALSEPPSYSSVRTMMRALESKGLLLHRQAGTKYVYRAKTPRASAARSALSHLVRTFFEDSPAAAVAAILDDSSTRLSEQDLQRLEKMIEQARREGK
ncbi:MAG: BlaI/MecI/CopY family transcriptional regulator [Planctomycetota bacterium]|nr:BlaI/MecI/CopY family transcriptional regulator [Planctomycetota bacterium]